MVSDQAIDNIFLPSQIQRGPSFSVQCIDLGSVCQQEFHDLEFRMRRTGHCQMERCSSLPVMEVEPAFFPHQHGQCIQSGIFRRGLMKNGPPRGLVLDRCPGSCPYQYFSNVGIFVTRTVKQRSQPLYIGAVDIRLQGEQVVETLHFPFFDCVSSVPSHAPNHRGRDPPDASSR